MGAWPYMGPFLTRPGHPKTDCEFVSIGKLSRCARCWVARPVTPAYSVFSRRVLAHSQVRFATLEISKHGRLSERSATPHCLSLLAPSAATNPIRNISFLTVIISVLYFSHSTQCKFIIPSFLTVLISKFFFFFNS